MTKIILIGGKAQNGKDTLAMFLKQEWESDKKKVLVYHFADYLKYLCKAYFGWDGNKDEAGRFILQHVGTDIIREKNPDYWLNTALEFIKIFQDEYDYIIIPDVRFKNELRFIQGRKLWDVYSVRVTRSNFESPLTPEQQKHPSETDLDNFYFDSFIFAGTLAELGYLSFDLKYKIERRFYEQKTN